MMVWYGRPELGHEEHMPATTSGGCVPLVFAGDRDEAGPCRAASHGVGIESLVGDASGFVGSDTLASTGVPVSVEPGCYQRAGELLARLRGLPFNAWDGPEKESSEDEEDYDILDDDEDDDEDDDDDVVDADSLDDEDSVDDDDDDCDDDFDDDGDGGLFDEEEGDS